MCASGGDDRRITVGARAQLRCAHGRRASGPRAVGNGTEAEAEAYAGEEGCGRGILPKTVYV